MAKSRHDLTGNIWSVPIVDQSLKIISEIIVMRMLTKESLHRMWKNSLTSDWLPHGKARRFPHKEFYIDLKCTKDVKTAMTTHRDTD